jgi:serine/threonine protein kinase
MLINVDAMIKLCDFGICDKLTDIEPHGKGVLGDEKHLPPTYQHCTIQRDMYALGMSVLEMVSGKHPFADWARIDIKWKIREWKPLVPMTISKELQKLILLL